METTLIFVRAIGNIAMENDLDTSHILIPADAHDACRKVALRLETALRRKASPVCQLLKMFLEFLPMIESKPIATSMAAGAERHRRPREVRSSSGPSCPVSARALPSSSHAWRPYRP